MKIYSIVFIIIPFISFSQLYINEAMSSNKTIIQDEVGQFEDWIEIYNANQWTIDLQSYYLSDDPLNPQKWEITQSTIIPSGGYELFWADEDQSQGPNHTNFKISNAGETIYLASPSGVIIDQLMVPILPDDFSFGRTTDGSNQFATFSISSPNSSNSNGATRVEDVLFSIQGGVYNSNVNVTLSTNTPNATIRYTLDGSEPTSSSSQYNSSISINTVKTIRAKAFRSGWQPSSISSESYIVNTNHGLPIIIINTDPDNLWDNQIGIYVAGTNGITGYCSNDPKNFNQAWERPANVQFFDENGNFGFNIDAGISIAGGCSRRNAQKGLNIETKSIYPSENIPYQIFPNREQDKYRRIKLRQGGNDWWMSGLRDAATQRFIEDEVDVDLQSSREVVLYLNDDYWGVMKLRDVHSQHSINYKHPKVVKDSLNIFSAGLYHPVYSGDFDVKQGQSDDFFDLYNFISSNSLSGTTNYNYVSSKIDISEYINYHIIQIFAANTDWPSNNMDIWHEQNGKARWLLYDTDYGLGRNWTGNNPRTTNPPSFNAIGAATTSTLTGWPNDKAGTLILRKLLQNTSFRNEFVQRFATQLNILFPSNRTKSIVDEIANTLSSDMQGHLNKFNLLNGSMSNWWSEVNEVKSWLDQRPAHVFTNIRNHFGISGTYNLTINTNNNSNGRVLLNENEYLAPTNYVGTYFDNIPITLLAVANPGYRFSHWQETGNTSARITPIYSSNMTLTPVFVSALDVVINEIHYNPRGQSEAAEFIEIYNPNSFSINLSSYEFTDGICFAFPINTIIAGGEFILIANDPSIYAGNGYQVFQWDESKLKNDGEHLRLENGAGAVIDSLTYNDAGSWISTADNGFYSLALLDHSYDNAQAESWDVQKYYITPGAQNEFLPYDTYHFPSDLVINELHYHPFDSINPSGDTISSKNYEFVEIKNMSNTTISLTGVALSRGVTYQFPEGSTIPPNGLIVIAEDSLQFLQRYGFSPFGRYSGKLSNNGELIWLSNSIGLLMDAVKYQNVFPWETAANGGLFDYSLALIDATKTNDIYMNWKRQCTALQTPGEENDFACFNGLNFEGLMLNEIHYNPALGSNFEFIEIVNHSSILMNLREVSLTGGASFSFDTDVFLPGSVASPANYIVLANDSSSFHNEYGFAPDGVYAGFLSNSGGTIVLKDFFDKEIDAVNYDDVAPWPVEADQGRHSLALISSTLDNALGSNWCIQDVMLTPKAMNSFADSDSDTVIDCIDECQGLDDSLIGTACDDLDPCTIGESYINCECTGGIFQDSDSDGVCDYSDVCAGYDDNVDINNNGIPDGCENCSNYVINLNNSIIDSDTSAQIGIQSNGIIEDGRMVQYHAGSFIELIAGFEVQLGATFHAFILPCN